MAVIDYGALLRVDGKFINKNDELFMDKSDTGYVCEEAVSLYDGEKYPIQGNYFVYAGDEDFLLVFYKGICKVISHNKELLEVWWSPFDSETYFIDGFPSIKISHLDKELQNEYFDKPDRYDRDFYIRIYGKRRGMQKYYRHIKKSRRVAYKERTGRWLAEWEYAGKKYEVIYGYGIDPNEEIWKYIKGEGYNFTKSEITIIDEWFQNDFTKVEAAAIVEWFKDKTVRS